MDLIASLHHDLESARLMWRLCLLGFDFVEYRAQPVLGSN